MAKNNQKPGYQNGMKSSLVIEKFNFRFGTSVHQQKTQFFVITEPSRRQMEENHSIWKKVMNYSKYGLFHWCYSSCTFLLVNYLKMC